MTPTQLSIFSVSVSFLLFQFFLQLSSGVLISSIMREFHLSAFIAGVLSASFYVVYTGLQIPVGILFDQKNTRNLMAGSTLLCCLGCFLFAASHDLLGLFLGRILIGTGSAFAFVGMSHLLRQYFSKSKYAFLIGLSETIGFLVTVLGIIGMGTLIMRFGWHSFIKGAGIFGLMITGLAWKYIPSVRPQPNSSSLFLDNIMAILTSRKLWINGCFIGLTFTIVTVFGALWAAPYIQIKLDCSLRQASLINAFFFLGTGLSCPLFGWLSNLVRKRRRLMLISMLSTAVIFLIMLYTRTSSVFSMILFMFAIGLACGAYIIAYQIANELSPPGVLSACTGFINTLALITTPILQPFIGYLLDHFSHNGLPTQECYQKALLVMPISFLIASVLVYFLPEKSK